MTNEPRTGPGFLKYLNDDGLRKQAEQRVADEKELRQRLEDLLHRWDAGERFSGDEVAAVEGDTKLYEDAATLVFRAIVGRELRPRERALVRSHAFSLSVRLGRERKA